MFLQSVKYFLAATSTANAVTPGQCFLKTRVTLDPGNLLATGVNLHPSNSNQKPYYGAEDHLGKGMH
jgi:hypothetical protein